MLRWRTQRLASTLGGSSSCPTLEEIKTAVAEALDEHDAGGTTPECLVVASNSDPIVTSSGDYVITSTC